MQTFLFRRSRLRYPGVFKHPLEFLPIIALTLAPAIQPFLRVLDNFAVKRPYRMRVASHIKIIVMAYQLAFQAFEELPFGQIPERFEPRVDST